MSGENFFVSFLCPACRTEIEATRDLSGEETECPACGAVIKVPVGGGSGGGDAALDGAAKSRTIRIEIGDL